jgi:peptidyl-prolyl cis-trans isomerase A (cyclophilin A)
LKNRKWFALPIHSKREGKKAESGKTVAVHYEGSKWKSFDSSYPKPIELD